MAKWNPFRRRGARNARYLVRQLVKRRPREARGRHRLDRKAWRAQCEREAGDVSPDW